MLEEKKVGHWKENVEQRQVDTDQNGLQLFRCASALVHEHLLGNVFPVLHTVQLVVGVAVQHRPAQELCQGLEQTMSVRKNERKETYPHKKQESCSVLSYHPDV